MKTPKADRTKIRSDKLMIKMTAEEREKIENAANDMGLTMSAFARLAFKDFMKKANN